MSLQRQALQAFLNRESRHVKQVLSWIKPYQSWIAGGAAICLTGLLVFREHEPQDSRQIFHQEGHLDFKNASILGNPSRLLIQEEEAHLSKAQRTVLDSQTQLKKEVETLKAALEELRTSGGVKTAADRNKTTLTPSAAASGIPVNSTSSLPSALGSAPSFGPEPLQTEEHTQPGDEFNHTRIPSIQDALKTGSAAPERPLRILDGKLPHGSQKPGHSVISFPVKAQGKAYLKKPSIILPSGSYVKATLLTGVEAPEGKTYPVLLQLDFAYVIPNDKRLDLQGCFMIAKAQGDLSTERVQMQATKLSCVSRKSGMFEREVNGFVADDVDNSFAVMGSVNTKQDRVAATAFLSSIVTGIGKAIQQAQVTQQATALGGGQSIVTGDQAKFIGAGALSEPAAMVTQWYLKQAQNLLPTINVGSGQNVWIVMQDQVDLPKDYFNQNQNGGVSNASIYSYFSNLRR